MHASLLFLVNCCNGVILISHLDNPEMKNKSGFFFRFCTVIVTYVLVN